MRSPEPSKEMIHLGTVEYGGRDDESYRLLIREDGSHFVQIYYSPNRPFSRPIWGSPILPEEFSKHTVDGVPLEP